jgi:thiol-disulfide isomerase/thioredoxin
MNKYLIICFFILLIILLFLIINKYYYRNNELKNINDYKINNFLVNNNNDDNNNNNNLLINDDIIIVTLYYASWCSHCKPVKHFFNDLIKKSPSENIIFNKLEYEEILKQPELSKKIRGFPTIIIYCKNKEIIYDGERNKESLINYLNDL